MINKAIAGQSEFQSVNINVNGTVTVYGTKQKDTDDYLEYSAEEIDLIDDILALIASKHGYELGDTVKVKEELLSDRAISIEKEVKDVPAE